MHTSTTVDNQKSIIVRGLQFKVGSYITFHTQLFYFFRNGVGIAQEIAPVKKYKDVHLLGIDIPYEIVDIKAVHLANCTVKIPVITFKVKAVSNRNYSNLVQISGEDFISLNSKPVYIKEKKQIINKIKEIASK